MTGLIDCGGGMRGVYTSGIYDYLLDHNITIDYGIGVSAGAANMISYLAGQRGRTLTFFEEYTFRREYMSLSNWLKNRNYLNLEYIYSTLTNRGGEYPLDYEAFAKTDCDYHVVATDAQTGNPVYFTRQNISQDSYDVLKASSAIPLACKPYPVEGKLYFDGGVSDPVPYQKAFNDGCEKVVVLITRQETYVKQKQKNLRLLAWALRKYPHIVHLLEHRHEAYNQAIAEVRELAAQGKILLVAPCDECGVDTLTKDRDAFLRLYQRGYDDGAKVVAFLQKNKKP
ncbi:MAG: patatin family protein [Christensenella sp.]|uniref:patatin-like phospholipase family protein n=1 Tax=Christensenella sp. TaxID=1935934 RepID=UPI002B203190|nr:patatin family protein [Christensenella sp.]MEA5003684.1 patatin family protein [Christensenella sp.]